jgi:diguanylate cyclase (GGDEF)-like protein
MRENPESNEFAYFSDAEVSLQLPKTAFGLPMPTDSQVEPSQSPMLKRVAMASGAMQQDGWPAANGAPEGVCVFDANGVILATDAKASRCFSRAAVGGQQRRPTLSDLIGKELAVVWLAQLFELMTAPFIEATLSVEGSPFSLIAVEVRRLDGATGPLAVATFRPSAAEGPPSRDPLTGLPDRRAIGAWIAGLRRGESGPALPFAVLFLDLNDFKQVNDAKGHAVGDAVLAELAARWSSTVRDGDLVTRYGGDEFVILLRNIADLEAVEPIVERLRIATLAPIALGGTAITLSATIGVALSDGGDASPEHLIAAADEDMYARKRRRPK